MTKTKPTTGYSENGLPYFCLGTAQRVLVVFNGLDFENKPPSGLQLRWTAADYKQFAKQYTVYSVGRKPDLPVGYSTRDMANDYATMIQNQFSEPVDILGLSTGGTIAQYFALDHPELVRRLVLASTGYKLSENGKKLQLFVGEMARQRKWRKAFPAILDGLYPKGGLKKRFFKLMMWLTATFGAPKDPSDLVVTIEAEDNHNFQNMLPKIKVPTLVIGGEDDYFYPITETAAAIPNAKLVLYTNFGHSAWMDNRKQFQKDILDFLNQK
ncbi:MAG: alpha/beta hydrolase [Candidatus Bathyarchaeia archaeon]